jgi:hypothetical protein
VTVALETILTTVDWNSSISQFVLDAATVQAFQRGCHLASVWNYELSFQNFDNPALPFLQEMKACLFYVPACFGLGLYKPAASSMRAAVENGLYFSYFIDHPSELNTLMADSAYYISKTKILEYHNIHTLDFKKKQKLLGFTSELEAWYSEISAIVHGQIPGIWSSSALANTSFNANLSKAALREFNMAVQLINYLFLLTTDKDNWEGFSSPARQLFLKGMSGVRKRALDRAVV